MFNFGQYYLGIKTVHVLAVISWMAGILYYFRLFVYHFGYGQNNLDIHNLLSLMEKRLFKYITVPAMVLATVAGTLMVVINPGLLSTAWFRVKGVGVILMIGVTIYGLIPLRDFREKLFQDYSNRGLRMLNEVPTLLMLVIVIMVILKPF